MPFFGFFFSSARRWCVFIDFFPLWNRIKQFFDDDEFSADIGLHARETHLRSWWHDGGGGGGRRSEQRQYYYHPCSKEFPGVTSGGYFRGDGDPKTTTAEVSWHFIFILCYVIILKNIIVPNRFDDAAQIA